MSQRDDAPGGRPGLLDSLGRLFRSTPEPAEAPAAPPGGLAKLEQFDAALRDLNEKIAAQRAAGAAGPGVAARQPTPEAAAAARAKRIETVRQAMREDIVKMHARLGTGLSGADLDTIQAVVAELDAMAAAGKGSSALLPRARYAIVEKLRVESGEFAVARVVALLERQKMEWPDPSRPPASATPEEIERARRRRLADLRSAFLGESLARTAELLQGVVKGWGADYPERGSPLWEGVVLEGVAAGVRGRLLREFSEIVRRDRERLVSEAEAAVGKETAALQKTLAEGVHSLEQASRAVDGALAVLDEVLPAIAWERVRSQHPAAQGNTA